MFLWVTFRMYYATKLTFIFLIQRKKKKKFLQIKGTFLLPYSTAQICLLQRNFFWIEETFLWIEYSDFLPIHIL